MSLFNNMGSLMEVLMQPNQHEESQQLANRAGVDTNDFAKIASIGLPLILQGMNRNNQSQSGLDSFTQALNQHQTRNNYDSLSQFSRNVDPVDGDKIVGHVFNEEKNSVNHSVADRLGVSPEMVQKTLAILAPLAIKYLAERKQQQNLDAQGVQQETQNITREAAMQARELNKSDQTNSGGLLGDLLNSFTDSTDNKNDDGLLGSLFDLFK